MKRTLMVMAAALLAVLPLRESAAQNRKVTVSYGLPIFAPHTAPLFTVPKQAGFWAEEGLDVTILTAPNAGTVLQNLALRSIDLAMTAAQGMIIIRENGAQLKAVANFYAYSTDYIATLADSPIKSLKELKGKNVGACGPGTGCEQTLDAVLRYEGLDPNRDVNKVFVGQGAAALNALTTGRIAALSSNEPDYTLMELTGAKLRRFTDHPVTSGGNFRTAAIAREDTIKNDPKLIVSLLRGVAKGIVFATENPEAAMRMHWKEIPNTKPSGVDEAKALSDGVFALSRMLPVYRNTLTGHFGEVSEEAILESVKLTMQAGILKKPEPAAAYFTDQFLVEARNFDQEKIRALARAYKPN